MDRLNDYLTIGAAAQHLGVSRDSLRRWDRAGRLTACRHPVNGYRLYAQADLDAMLQDVTSLRAATSPPPEGTHP